MRVSRMELAAMSPHERMATLAKLAEPAEMAKAPRKLGVFAALIHLLHGLNPIRRGSR